MTHQRYRGDEVIERGEEIYARLRNQVETNDNIGKLISIDVETGDYEIDTDLIRAGDRLYAKHPNATLYGARIGYDAVYALGGTLTRTAK